MATHSKKFLPVGLYFYRNSASMSWNADHPGELAYDGDESTYARTASAMLTSENNSEIELEDPVPEELVYKCEEGSDLNATTGTQLYVFYNFDELPYSAQVTAASMYTSMRNLNSSTEITTYHSLLSWYIRNYTSVGTYETIYTNTATGEGTQNGNRMFWCKNVAAAGGTATYTCNNSSTVSSSFLQKLLYSEGSITQEQWHIKHSETSARTGPTFIFRHCSLYSSGTWNYFGWNELC